MNPPPSITQKNYTQENHTRGAEHPKESQRYLVQGVLNVDTVVNLTRQGIDKIVQAQTEKINFDLVAVKIEDASAIAMLLAWIRSANQHKRCIEFNHIPEKLLAIAELGGVDKIIQAHAVSIHP